jgi:hypothetical protein
MTTAITSARNDVERGMMLALLDGMDRASAISAHGSDRLLAAVPLPDLVSVSIPGSPSLMLLSESVGKSKTAKTGKISVQFQWLAKAKFRNRPGAHL